MKTFSRFALVNVGDLCGVENLFHIFAKNSVHFTSRFQTEDNGDCFSMASAYT